jgi:hypothetical protein
MNHTATPDNALTLLIIEAGLTAIVFAVSYCIPHFGNGLFSAVERMAGKLAHRKAAAVASVGCAMLLVRAAMLPWFPPPQPFTTDDFSFLLAADTFAHGRLTNPTPAMWTHFESIHITVQPTYMSMYFPAQGLLMALGSFLFGHPWACIFLMSGLTCASICWMLQAWLPPQWALLGGILAILRIGLFSYWVNSYTGAATITAFCGALILGSMPRLMRTSRIRYALLMALGVALIAITRPYEGLLLSLPVLAVLVHWVFFAKNRPPFVTVLRLAVPSLALIAVALAWLGFYDYHAFGKPSTLPYTVARTTYAVVPYYIWQHALPTPNYRHREMRRFYTENEASDFNRLHSLSGFFSVLFDKLCTGILTFAGFALLPPLIMSRRVLRDRRVRFLVCCLPIWIAGLAIGIFMIPHYLAPFTAGAYALGLQAMRHLYVWKPEGKPVGRTLVRFSVVTCLMLAGLRLDAKSLHLSPPEWPAAPWLCSWIGPEQFGLERAQTLAQLEKIPGKHLLFVRYGPAHDPRDEWMYNAADIDASRVIWAREMDAASNRELTQYYKDRDVWLVQPDLPQSERLQPYPARP